MSTALRRYIRILVEEVMGEPDQSKEDTRYDDEEGYEDENPDESVGVGAIAGAITPMGTSATYPNDPAPKRRKSPAQAAGSAFGGAKPYYMTHRKKR
jgi:hypothetical protein